MFVFIMTKYRNFEITISLRHLLRGLQCKIIHHFVSLPVLESGISDQEGQELVIRLHGFVVKGARSDTQSLFSGINNHYLRDVLIKWHYFL